MNDFFAQIYRQNELYDIWAKKNRMKPSTVAVLYLLDQFETCTQGWISKIYLLPKQTIHTVVQERLRPQGKAAASDRIRQALHSG